MAEYVADADKCNHQPYGGDKATNPGSKVGERIPQFLLQETNQTGNVKGVSRIHAGNGLIMTIAWSGKSKRSHTMWVL